MQNEDFCAFILTHGRADRVFTYETLKSQGYTGKVYIVIDNEDKTSKDYYETFGDKVIMFDKLKASKETDEGDNFNDRRAIIYARNACFEIAKGLGIKYFIELDDDYTAFYYKVDKDNFYVSRKIKNLDSVFSSLLKYYKSINALSLAMAQGGDYLGGIQNATWKNGFLPTRKCMNTFICSTERPFKFVGKINEDVNTYTSIGKNGGLFLTIPNIAVIQKQTQHNPGGMTDIYLDSGTYVKSFYTVMYNPSSVKIHMMHSANGRLHHKIQWKNTVPVIIEEKYKKVK